MSLQSRLLIALAIWLGPAVLIGARLAWILVSGRLWPPAVDPTEQRYYEALRRLGRHRG